MAKKPTKPEEKKTPNARREPFTSSLRVALTQNEVADRADRAAMLEDEIDQRIIDQKEQAKKARGVIARITAEKRALQGDVRARATYREVSCERRFLYDEGLVIEVRLDNGEELSRRTMTAEEKQQFLPFNPDGQNGVPGGDLDDEFGGGDSAE
jgi:hypothetical protein